MVEFSKRSQQVWSLFNPSIIDFTILISHRLHIDNVQDLAYLFSSFTIHGEMLIHITLPML